MHEEGFRFLTSRDDKASAADGKVDVRVSKSEQSWRGLRMLAIRLRGSLTIAPGRKAEGPGNSCGAFPV